MELLFEDILILDHEKIRAVRTHLDGSATVHMDGATIEIPAGNAGEAACWFFFDEDRETLASWVERCRVSGIIDVVDEHTHGMDPEDLRATIQRAKIRGTDRVSDEDLEVLRRRFPERIHPLRTERRPEVPDPAPKRRSTRSDKPAPPGVRVVTGEPQPEPDHP